MLLYIYKNSFYIILIDTRLVAVEYCASACSV